MVRKSVFFLFGLGMFLGLPSISQAELGSYGYIIGTLDTRKATYENDDDIATVASYGLEPISRRGRFLHYYFFVNVNGSVYKCVIDVNDANLYNVPYRIVTMRSYNASYYNGVFSKPNGVYRIPMNGQGTAANSGALDYIRHPGILLDMAGGSSWQSDLSYVTDGGYYVNEGAWSDLRLIACDGSAKYPCAASDLYYAPDIDDLFKNVSKLYVFGDFFRDGSNGLHNIHQNQGNRLNDYVSSGGVYQDGAVIFEYPNGTRKMLMVKFGDYNEYDEANQQYTNRRVYNQIDFTYSKDPDGAGTKKVAEGAPFITEIFNFDPKKSPEGQVFGPFYADQIEVMGDVREDDCMNYGDIDIYMSDQASVSRTSYLIYSKRTGCVNEYLRSSTDLWKAKNATNLNTYYFYVHPFTNDDSSRIIVRYR